MMQPTGPDQALRRLVADLAGQPAADVAAVLSALGPQQRGTVETLLAAYGGEENALLSPWIVDRLAGRSSSLTPHSIEVLRECFRQSVPRTTASAARSPSLLARLMALLGGGRLA